MNTKVLIIGLMLWLLPLAAQAHEPKAASGKGPQTAHAGSYHVELVARGSELQVYLSDEADKPISTQGFKGTAILVIGGKTERIALTPEGENALKGTATMTLPAAPKGAVQIIPPSGATVQAKFN